MAHQKEPTVSLGIARYGPRSLEAAFHRDGSCLELYDLTAEPYEDTDLKPRHPEVVQQMTSQLEQWKMTLPDKPTGNVFSSECRESLPSSK